MPACWHASASITCVSVVSAVWPVACLPAHHVHSDLLFKRCLISVIALIQAQQSQSCYVLKTKPCQICILQPNALIKDRLYVGAAEWKNAAGTLMRPLDLAMESVSNEVAMVLIDRAIGPSTSQASGSRQPLQRLVPVVQLSHAATKHVSARKDKRAASCSSEAADPEVWTQGVVYLLIAAARRYGSCW